MCKEEANGPLSEQTEWFNLREKHGEEAAYLELARRLREAADHLEKLASGEKQWPDVFGCRYPRSEPIASGKSFIDGVSVTLSWPWPG